MMLPILLLHGCLFYSNDQSKTTPLFLHLISLKASLSSSKSSLLTNTELFSRICSSNIQLYSSSNIDSIQ